MAAEETNSDAFNIGFESTNNGSKAASFHCVENVLIEMAQTGALDEMFDRRIERWTQSSTFMDALARRAIASHRFVRPVSRFIYKTMKEQS